MYLHVYEVTAFFSCIVTARDLKLGSRFTDHFIVGPSLFVLQICLAVQFPFPDCCALLSWCQHSKPESGGDLGWVGGCGMLSMRVFGGGIWSGAGLCSGWKWERSECCKGPVRRTGLCCETGLLAQEGWQDGRWDADSHLRLISF